MSCETHCCTWLLWVSSNVQVTEGYLPPLASCSKHSSTDNWWEKWKNFGRRKPQLTVSWSLCRILGCLTAKTCYYCYYYSIFCWNFLCNNIASLLITAITCSWAQKTRGPISLCSHTPFYLGDIQEHRDAQAGPRLLGINAARFQAHLDVGDRLICSCSLG